MSKKKKRIITLSVLGGILLVLAIVYFAVILPIMTKEDEVERYKPEMEEGEGMYYSLLTMYPTIETTDVNYITIKNSSGEFVLENRINEQTGYKRLAFKEYPNLTLDLTILGNLNAVTLNSTVYIEENDEGQYIPVLMRNCDEEKMKTHGVTEDTCLASYTLNYKDKESGEAKEHTVYIGYAGATTTKTYYATVKGRNTIYLIEGGYLDQSLMLPQEGFVDLDICKDMTLTESSYYIQRVILYDVVGTTPTPVVGVLGDQHITAEGVLTNFTMIHPEKASNVRADLDYLSNVFDSLFCSFAGKRVISISPSDEILQEYNLGADDELYMVRAKRHSDDDDLYVFVFSKKNDEGNYYFLKPGNDKKNIPSLLMEIDGTNYSFLEPDNAIEWIATNSIESGFMKYIRADETSNQSGVKDITISAKSRYITNYLDENGWFNEKFNLEYSTNEDDVSVLTVTCDNSGKVFKDDLTITTGSTNPFKTLYGRIETYPMPRRFDEYTDAERENIKKPENLVYSLRVTLNDGTKLGYDYYIIQNESAFAMCEFFDDLNTTPKVVFDVSVGDINTLMRNINQLMNDEKID